MKFPEAVRDTWDKYKDIWVQIARRGDVINPIKKVFGGLVELVGDCSFIALVVLCLPLFPVGVVVRMYKGWKNK